MGRLTDVDGGFGGFGVGGLGVWVGDLGVWDLDRKLDTGFLMHGQFIGLSSRL